MLSNTSSALATTAAFVMTDALAVRPGQQVVITADDVTDLSAVHALFNAARVVGAEVSLITMPQIPFQGALADPYIPEPLSVAVQNCDVWIDLSFPYLSGSTVHAKSMAGGRTRLLSIGGLDAPGLVRLFGKPDYDKLYELQRAVDRIFAVSDARCRVTSPLGTDVTFTTTRPAPGKPRVMKDHGTYTPMGSAVIHPDPASVKGRVVIGAAFHEYMTVLDAPIEVEVDGEISSLTGGGVDLRIMKRALRRANGGGDSYGSIIHFSHAFHPYARSTGSTFIEDIRVTGSNAIGFGIPWWEEGGGENHPDGVVTQQSLWIDDRQIVADGQFVDAELQALELELFKS